MGRVHQLAFDLGAEASRKRAKGVIERGHPPIEGNMMTPVEVENIQYMYSGFAMTMLPHKRLDDGKLWKRENGKLTLLVEPGAILQNGEAVHYGVPYGSRARLIMFYLQTEAIRTRSPVVHLGSSMTRWMKSMNIPTGGKNFEQVRDQARRLSACRLTVGWMDETGHSGFRRENIVGAMIMPPSQIDMRQGSLWEETAQLSDGFYQALLQHPVPCDGAAIRVLQSKSQAIDLYVWLCYRLNWIDKPVTVPWSSLFAQFGHSYANERQFRWRFKGTLDEALSVYREARVEFKKEGLMLIPSPPAVPPRVMSQVTLPEPSNVVTIPGSVIESSAAALEIS